VLVGRDGASADPVPLAGLAPIALLGVDDAGAALWLAAAPEGAALRGLRDLAGTSDAAASGLLAYAMALSHFHRTHRFCGRCGEPMESREGGHARVCVNDHTAHPRTDPVVIMLVCDGADRVLLGRQRTWPRRRFSALAGFVEAGEDLESAVIREVAEESGLQVGAVRYVASQPWPFPASLMLGFHTDYVAGEPQPLDGELEDVRWFSRAEIHEAVEHDVDFLGTTQPPGDGLIVPPRIAIARHLIDRWLSD
jgi:NAD+ diphosphatase